MIFIYLFDTMAVWLDQSAGSNREENGKAEINPCFMLISDWINMNILKSFS